MAGEQGVEAFKMPADYKDWVEDVERVHHGITALAYAHYALVERHLRRRRGHADLSTDDVPVYDAVVSIHDAVDKLQAILVGWGVPVPAVERENVLTREMCRVFPGNHQ